MILSGAAAGLACRRAEPPPPPPPVPATPPPPRPEAPPLSTDRLDRFVDRLPIPAALKPMGTRADPRDPGRQLAFHRVLMTEAAVKVHRDVPLTRVWTYGGLFPGPTIDTRRGTPILIEWINGLPAHPFLPAGGASEVRAAAHVHGALTPPQDDGDPARGVAPGQSITRVYPNTQEAATLWYHDEALGAARVDQYAGLAGVYLVRDDHEATLALPGGALDLPLVLGDGWFGQDGQLRPPGSGTGALLVNGTLFPYADLPPRRHRVRVVNASNAADCALTFDPPIALHQIGTDQGLLSAPIEVATVHLAPGERADLLVEFGRAAGRAVVLKDRSRELMQFRVAAGPAPREAPVPRRLRDTPLPRLQPGAAGATRTLAISEPGERPGVPPARPRLHTAELWNVVNQSSAVRVLHVPGVRFRVLDAAPGTSADGWKDTVRVEPSRTTRLWVQFDGYPGRYLWRSAALEPGVADVAHAFEVVGPPT